MDQQVRVTADRRGEVGVMGFGQAEVAEAFWRVDRAFEGAKKADLEGIAVRAAR